MDIKQEHHALLSGEDKQEFEIWEELLNHRGYALLHEFLSGHNDSCAAVIQNPGTWDNHNYARGYRDALALVLNLEAILEAKWFRSQKIFSRLSPMRTSWMRYQ